MSERGATSSRFLESLTRESYKERTRPAQISKEVWELLDKFVRTNPEFKKVYFTDKAITEAIKWRLLQMSDEERSKQPQELLNLIK